MLKTDVKFVVDSDAHSKERVGEISLVEDLIKRVNVPLSRIANVDGKLQKFRFNEFKNGAGR